MELYEKIVFLRRKNGLSQQELADKLEISRQSVYKWEQGLTSPDITKLPELAKIFNVTVDDLLNNEIDEKTLSQDKVVEEVKENTPQQTTQTRRSMLDYLLMIPFALLFGILIFMFYCFGFMAIGFLYSMLAISIISPFYGLLMIVANASNGAGAIFICIAIIIAGLGAIYPLYLAADKWRVKYFILAKRLTNWIKNYNWRKMI